MGGQRASHRRERAAPAEKLARGLRGRGRRRGLSGRRVGGGGGGWQGEGGGRGAQPGPLVSQSPPGADPPTHTLAATHGCCRIRCRHRRAERRKGGWGGSRKAEGPERVGVMGGGGQGSGREGVCVGKGGGAQPGPVSQSPPGAGSASTSQLSDAASRSRKNQHTCRRPSIRVTFRVAFRGGLGLHVPAERRRAAVQEEPAHLPPAPRPPLSESLSGPAIRVAFRVASCRVAVQEEPAHLPRASG